jgi:hypothetical protein
LMPVRTRLQSIANSAPYAGSVASEDSALGGVHPAPRNYASRNECLSDSPMGTVRSKCLRNRWGSGPATILENAPIGMPLERGNKIH